MSIEHAVVFIKMWRCFISIHNISVYVFIVQV